MNELYTLLYPLLWDIRVLDNKKNLQNVSAILKKDVTLPPIKHD